MPTDLLYFAFGLSIPYVRMNRLLRFRRANECIDTIETVSKWPNVLRIVELSAIAFVLFHWDGCFYFMLSRWYGIGMSSWAFNYGRIVDPIANCPADNTTFWTSYENMSTCKPVVFPNLTKQYLLSFYWAALILDSVGEQPPPVEIGQYIFTITNTIIGTFGLASIVGNVSTMITTINISQTTFMECLDSVKRYMEFRKVQPILKRRVIDWFNYVREEKLSLDDNKILSVLPKNLRSELSIAIHLHTMAQVKLFQDCEPGLMAEIVVRLKLQIFNPGDYVCRKGDVGNEMYIVEKGVINVVAEDGVTTFATLSEGSVFGEISILNIPGNKNKNRRTASVRSVGYSKLFALTKEDLWEALTEYPEARKCLLEKGKELLRKDHLLDDDAETCTAAFSPSIQEKLQYISKEASALQSTLDNYLSELREENQEAAKRIFELEKVLESEIVF
ncbi:unnamed protein product [Soboliphyme baturini]|uniref:Cyclic nucleotide-binding domain-containing protein n=1 Tax=Soboliphyme baturini TaxID=241478 RepID=A0A183ICY0_9BILA|nr:unnamed protein product [Soboliphyme baturini]